MFGLCSLSLSTWKILTSNLRTQVSAFVDLTLPSGKSRNSPPFVVLYVLSGFLQLSFGVFSYLLSKSQKVRTNAARLFFSPDRPDPPTALLSFTGYLWSRESTTNCPLLFFVRSRPDNNRTGWLGVKHQNTYYFIRTVLTERASSTDLSELLHLYTPPRQLRSCADTRVFTTPSFRTKPVLTWPALFLLLACLEPTPCFCPLCFLVSSFNSFFTTYFHKHFL